MDLVRVIWSRGQWPLLMGCRLCQNTTSLKAILNLSKRRFSKKQRNKGDERSWRRSYTIDRRVWSGALVCDRMGGGQKAGPRDHTFGHVAAA